MKHYFVIPWLILSVLLSVFLTAHADEAPSGRHFLLFYSNDVRGETEPCG